jgi:ribosome-associated protein
VQLYFALATNRTLHPSAKARIRAAHPSMLNADGDLIIAVDRHRSRKMNVDDARSRLADIVRRHLHPPKPRRATKPTKGSKKRRLDGKTRRGAIKRNRGRVRHDD